MKVLVFAAGIIGISAAWHLLERGHDVVVVERQADAAQISVSYCETWASKGAPV